MKGLLLASTAVVALSIAPANAADLKPRMVTKAPAAAAAWDWTGFYIGAYAGVGVDRSHRYDPTGLRVGELFHVGSGFNGGGTAGYNWQVTPNIVLGVEGDIGWLNLSSEPKDWNDAFTHAAKTSWLATLRGRAGWSSGPTLSYITGGAAWVNVDDRVTTTAGVVDSSKKTLTGYALGSGVETMLGGGWTAKSEYLFVDAGAGDTLIATAYPQQTDKHRYHMQRFGVNYLFGAARQPALPQNNWTGFFGGIVGGSGVSEVRLIDPAQGDIGMNPSGFSIGGIAGYNWQFAPSFVAGVEGDISGLWIDQSHINYFNATMETGIKTHWVATLRGRLGYSTGPALLYVTGGGAWVNVTDANGTAGNPSTSDRTLSGYTVGGGIETVFAGNWSTRTEYLFTDVGNNSVPLFPDRTMTHKFHLFRSGLTYKFGG
jgi:outer membrane immunogenic protein